MMETFAKRLKYAMDQAGLKQVGLAEGTVAMWDTGKNKPRADMLPKIAKLYGCTVDELLQETDPTTGKE